MRESIGARVDELQARLREARTAVSDGERQTKAEAEALRTAGEARARGYARLSLETGTGPDFAAALSFYRRHGFRSGEAFADYEPSDFNQFLHLQLHGGA